MGRLQAYLDACAYYEHKAAPVKGSRMKACGVLPRVRRAAALMKRWLLGTHQGSGEMDRLQVYLDACACHEHKAVPVRVSGMKAHTVRPGVRPVAALVKRRLGIHHGSVEMDHMRRISMRPFGTLSYWSRSGGASVQGRVPRRYNRRMRQGLLSRSVALVLGVLILKEMLV